jgi:hypothetical protein
MEHIKVVKKQPRGIDIYQATNSFEYIVGQH